MKMNFNLFIKWAGKSVSGLVVIAGIICIILYAIINKIALLVWGVIFVLLGLIFAFLMTLVIRNSGKKKK